MYIAISYIKMNTFIKKTFKNDIKTLKNYKNTHFFAIFVKKYCKTLAFV